MGGGGVAEGDQQGLPDRGGGAPEAEGDQLSVGEHREVTKINRVIIVLADTKWIYVS